MSLIQIALEKTRLADEKQIKIDLPKPRPHDPMGENLEAKLTRVQEQYASRQKKYWTWSVVGLLLVVAGIFLYFARPASPVMADLPKRNMAKVVVTTSIPSKIQAGIVPVRMPVRSVTVPFQLTGITNLGQRTVAIINDQIVGVGDPLSGNVTVKSISDGNVFLDAQGQEIRLSL